MKSKIATMLALAGLLGAATQAAAETYYMRVPAPAKCAGGTCAMKPTLPDAAVKPTKPVPSGTISINPAAGFSQFDFGKMAIGDTVTAEYKFTNTGAEPLTLIASTTTGGDFTAGALFNLCGRPARPGFPVIPLPPGESCRLLASFSPQTAGPRTSTLSVRTADATVASVTLRGDTGTAKVALGSGAGNGIDFGTVALNTPTTRKFTVVNTGDAAAQVKTYVSGSTGDQISWQMPHDCNQRIEPGQGCTVTVTVTVKVPGSYQYPWSLNASSGSSLELPFVVTAQ